MMAGGYLKEVDVLWGNVQENPVPNDEVHGVQFAGGFLHGNWGREMTVARRAAISQDRRLRPGPGRRAASRRRLDCEPTDSVGGTGQDG